MNYRPTGHGLRARPPRGFTLVELLIAMALTLMLVYAVAQFYAYVGETVRDGRGQIEMGNNLRQAASRLQQDFAELTVRVGGRIDAGAGQGHLELVEGGASDADPDGNRAVDANFVSTNMLDVNNDLKPDGPMMGDLDDILSFTIRSQGEPFVGRRFTGLDANGIAQYAIIQSNLAEVIWFTTFKDANSDGVWQITEPRFLVRRQLLIRPDLTVSWPTSPGALPAGESIYHHNDISCHVILNGMGNFSGYVTNSLGDLSQRENRCVHQNLNQATLNLNGLRAAQGYMPNTVQLNVGQLGSCSLYSLDGILQFHGEDKMLSNVLAFDVRVYDPYAVLRADNLDLSLSTGTTDDDAQGVLQPGDAGYARAVLSNHPIMGNGAYVDLWYNRGYENLPALQRNQVLQNSAYSWAPQARNFPGGAIWETWTTALEKDGLPQGMPTYLPFPNIAQRATADWMVDGLDNDNSSGVDNPGEAETRPPYPVYVGDNGVDDNYDGNVDDAGAEQLYPRPIPTTLRGIEVRIRMYEPGTRQTRQVTVATDFIPE